MLTPLCGLGRQYPQPGSLLIYPSKCRAAKPAPQEKAVLNLNLQQPLGELELEPLVEAEEFSFEAETNFPLLNAWLPHLQARGPLARVSPAEVHPTDSL